MNTLTPEETLALTTKLTHAFRQGYGDLPYSEKHKPLHLMDADEVACFKMGEEWREREGK